MVILSAREVVGSFFHFLSGGLAQEVRDVTRLSQELADQQRELAGILARTQLGGVVRTRRPASTRGGSGHLM